MDEDWLDSRGALLTHRCPLPLTEPFTARQAAVLGVSRHRLRELVEAGLLRRVLRGVYAAAQAPNDTLLRARALALVIPRAAVVVDRTAAWLHGVELLPRSALWRPPPLDVCHVTDTRMRRSGVDGRRRGLLERDVVEIEGVRATVPWRTALDLGRLLWRFDALAAIDGFLRLGVPMERMQEELGRFRGYRGVRQLRRLLPLGDPLAESVGESGLRLHWIEAGLPRPVLQVWIHDDAGVPIYRLDITDPEVRYAAEYDGEGFHTSQDEQEHDRERRGWICEHRHWIIDAFDKEAVYGRHPLMDPQLTLRGGYNQARRSMSLWTPGRRG